MQKHTIIFYSLNILLINTHLYGMEKVTALVADQKQEFANRHDRRLHESLRSAAEKLNLKKLNRLLKKPGLDVNRILSEQGPALCIAVLALNKRWYNPILNLDCTYSPDACHRFIETLVQHGANINAPNDQGDTPLHLVPGIELDPYFFWHLHKWKLINLLLELGADVNALNVAQETPLHKAINCDESLVNLLLTYKPNIYAQDACGKSPFFYAAAMQTRLLLQHALSQPPAPHTPEWYELIYRILCYERYSPKELDFNKIKQKLGIKNTTLYNDFVRHPKDQYSIDIIEQIFTKFAHALFLDDIGAVKWYLENGISPCTDFAETGLLFISGNDWQRLHAMGSSCPLSLAYMYPIVYAKPNNRMIQLLLDRGGLTEYNGFAAVREIYKKGLIEFMPLVITHVPQERIKRYWQQSILPLLCCKQVAQLPKDVRIMFCMYILRQFLVQNRNFALKLFEKKKIQRFIVRKVYYTKNKGSIPFVPLKSQNDLRNKMYQQACEQVLDGTFEPHWYDQISEYVKRHYSLFKR